MAIATPGAHLERQQAEPRYFRLGFLRRKKEDLPTEERLQDREKGGKLFTGANIKKYGPMVGQTAALGTLYVTGNLGKAYALGGKAVFYGSALTLFLVIGYCMVVAGSLSAGG